MEITRIWTDIRKRENSEDDFRGSTRESTCGDIVYKNSFQTYKARFAESSLVQGLRIASDYQSQTAVLFWKVSFKLQSQFKACRLHFRLLQFAT